MITAVFYISMHFFTLILSQCESIFLKNRFYLNKVVLIKWVGSLSMLLAFEKCLREKVKTNFQVWFYYHVLHPLM